LVVMASSLTWRCMSLALVVLALYTTQAMSRNLQELSMEDRHEQWMTNYGLVYKDSVEKEMRFQVFKTNVEYIDTFNKVGDRTYVLSVNGFADQTNEEFIASRNGYKNSLNESLGQRSGNKMLQQFHLAWIGERKELSHLSRTKANATSPSSCLLTIFDVKILKNTGSCWAFSTVASMEGITQLSTGKLISLSEQELVDCDVNGEDQGCEGGLMDDAFDFIVQNHGLATEGTYPYKAIDGACDKKKKPPMQLNITGHEDVPANDEKALLKAVANQPIAVAIDASGSAFQFYSSGVFTGDCGTQLDHGVTAVGYGTASDGTKYWLVKNSWGTSWGENGYIRMQRDIGTEGGICGIAMMASYPTAYMFMYVNGVITEQCTLLHEITNVASPTSQGAEVDVCSLMVVIPTQADVTTNTNVNVARALATKTRYKVQPISPHGTRSRVQGETQADEEWTTVRLPRQNLDGYIKEISDDTLGLIYACGKCGTFFYNFEYAQKHLKNDHPVLRDKLLFGGRH
ncbi:hypothetical protein IFM89_007930, partial [Coptis chinensis]